MLFDPVGMVFFIYSLTKRKAIKISMLINLCILAIIALSVFAGDELYIHQESILALILYVILTLIDVSFIIFGFFTIDLFMHEEVSSGQIR